ncbi:MAG: diaminopimelate decarboxylase [Gammaproteobacteria bacterium]|nr:diaminopimelate decarboxylase [Gammaproteobacteria bacterium]
MNYFNDNNNRLFVESVAVENIVSQYGTPCYVYSKSALEQHWTAFDQALQNHPHLICYAVKANSNLAVLNVLAKLGSGFDIVSIGELERVLKAQGQPSSVVFSGVGKRNDEIERALEVGIRCFNVEVVEELDRINRIADKLGKRAPVSIRVNPDVDPQTHPYISTGLKENKFGIDMDIALDVYRHASQLNAIDVVGMDCHIGSQLTELEPFGAALDRMLRLLDQLQQTGIRLTHLDLGGGLGIRYADETPPSPGEYADVLLSRLADTHYEIILEPGRAIAGNAGILVTRVEYLKQTAAHHFAIVDAAMNDLLRPSLYQAWHDIILVNPGSAENKVYDIVGPVCETGDFLGKQRQLAIQEQDLLAICSAGAYGFVMSSNYNSRPRPPEVMVDGDQTHLIRKRETIESLWSGENILP